MRRSSAALMFAVAAMAAGCSFGESESSTKRSTTESVAKGPSGLTKTGFAVQADEICAQYLAEAAQLPSPVRRRPSGAELEEYAHLLRRQREALAALEPPPGQEDAVDEWLDDQEEHEGLYPDTEAHEDPVAGPIVRLEAELERQSIAFGMKTCFIARPTPE